MKQNRGKEKLDKNICNVWQVNTYCIKISYQWLKKDGTLQNKNEKGCKEAIHILTHKDYQWPHEKMFKPITKQSFQIQTMQYCSQEIGKNQNPIIMPRTVKGALK